MDGTKVLTTNERTWVLVRTI